MDEVDRLAGAARRSVVQLMAEARDQISRGADLERIQDRYVSVALRRLEDVEAYAVLASGGAEDALAAIKRLIEEIEELHRSLREEGS